MTNFGRGSCSGIKPLIMLIIQSANNKTAIDIRAFLNPYDYTLDTNTWSFMCDTDRLIHSTYKLNSCFAPFYIYVDT